MSFPAQYSSLTNAANVLYLDSSVNNSTVTSVSQNISGSPYQGPLSPYGNSWSVFYGGLHKTQFSTGTQFVYGTGAVTLEAFVYYSSNNLQQRIWCQTDVSHDDFVLMVKDTDWLPLCAFAGGTLTSYTKLTYNKWQHLAFVREGTGTNQSKLYIDGVLVAVGTCPNNWTNNTYLPTIAGPSQVGLSEQWFGWISNLRIVKGTAVYVGGTTTGTTYFSPPTAPLSVISGTSLLACADRLYSDKSTYNNQTTSTIYYNNISKWAPFEKYGNDDAKTKSRIGGSAYFPGAAAGGEKNYLTVTGASTSTLHLGNDPDWTIELWFYCTKINQDIQILVDKDGLSGVRTSSWSIRIGAGATTNATTATVYATTYNNGSGLSIGNYIIGINRWYHVAYVQTGGTIYFYVNGIVTGNSLTTAIPTPATSNIVVGYQINNKFAYHFCGYISDLHVTRRAVYTGNFTPPVLPIRPDANTALLLNFTNYKIIDYTGNFSVLPLGSMSTTDVVKYNSSSLRFNGYDHIKLFTTINYNKYSGMVFQNGLFTVESWVFVTSYNSGPDSAGFFNIIYGDTDVGSDGLAWAFGFDSNGRPFWYNAGTSGTYRISYILPLNIWFHLAWVGNYNSAVNNSYVSIYINGQLQPYYQSTSTSQLLGSLTPNLDYRPMVGSDRGRGFWSGYLEDLRVTKGVARYTQNFIPPSGPLPKG
jgi:hypothetical protein